MPTTSTSQFALYQALFVKVSQSLLLCYNGTVYFLFFCRCVQGRFLAIEVNLTGTHSPVEKREEIWRESHPPVPYGIVTFLVVDFEVRLRPRFILVAQ